MKLDALLDPPLALVCATWPIRHPDDSSECVFMGRAVHELARAKYGSAWTGDEPHTQLPELLPDALNPMHYNALCQEAASNSDEPAQWFDPPPRAVLERADNLLAQHRPDLQRSGRFLGLLARPIRFSIREWKIAQSLARKERDDCLVSLIRWIDLQREIVSFCESGVLDTVLRPVDGGDYSQDLPKAHWRTEAYAVRFITFMMHPVLPFSRSNPPGEMQWVFFTRASLRRAIAKLEGQSEVSADSAGAAYASEYMRHMTLVATALGITAENQLKKIEVERAVRDFWTGSTPLSQSDIQGMASFIRLQASRGGRNKLRQ